MESVQMLLGHLKASAAMPFAAWIEKELGTALYNNRAKESPCSILPLTSSSFEVGRAYATAQSLADDACRDIALAEYHYYRAEPAQCSAIAAPHLASENPLVRLSACWLYGYANVALGRVEETRRSLKSIESCLRNQCGNHASSQVRASASLVATGASVLLHLPTATAQAMRESMTLLPEGMRLFASYILAHQAYLAADYAQSAGIVEGVLAFSSARCPIPRIYLHLVAVMDYMSLRDLERAERHFDQAWQLALPDGLIEPFAEHHGLIQGMLERRVKKEYPDHFKRIIETTYRFAAGWRRIHNPTTKSEVADNLTTTQFSVAMLACRSWTNKEIASYLGISENTVKTYLSEVYGKLGIANRSDLKRFMLK